VQSGLDVPTPCRRGEIKPELPGQAAEIGILYGLRRQSGVQIDGNIERLRRFKNRRKPRVIKEHAFRGPVYQHALKSQFLHTAFQFGGSLLWLLQSQGRKTGEALRVSSHRGGQLVIGIARQSRRPWAI